MASFSGISLRTLAFICATTLVAPAQHGTSTGPCNGVLKYPVGESLVIGGSLTTCASGGPCGPSIGGPGDCPEDSDFVHRPLNACNNFANILMFSQDEESNHNWIGGGSGDAMGMAMGTINATPGAISVNFVMMGSQSSSASINEELCDGVIPPGMLLCAGGAASTETGQQAGTPFKVTKPARATVHTDLAALGGCALGDEEGPFVIAQWTITAGGATIATGILTSFDGMVMGFAADNQTFDLEPGDYYIQVTFEAHAGVGSQANCDTPSDQDTCVANDIFNLVAKFRPLN